MSAAVLAEGETWIENAACEPEVVDLGCFLQKLGARITGLGTSRVHIRGVAKLGGVCYRIIPDRIEAATLMAATAITRGGLKLLNARRSHLTAVISALREIGVTIESDASGLVVEADRTMRAAAIVARPYPAVPTDVQAQLTTLLSVTEGTSRVRDDVFPDRFQHINELRRMGAQIRKVDNAAIITGVRALVGAEVTATDLRASAALVLGGLAALGETTVRQISHLDRGYEQLEKKLASVGADIRRVSEESPQQLRAA
jgi:UDP-N-acetylglucosamine 1-carboxyvinyltransferase